MDGRRRRYVPLSVHFAAGGTGTKLQDRFGLEGLAVWCALLAAAKLSPEQGTFEYVEGDEWRQLGLRVRPSFTIDEFLAYTGKLKQTSRRRSGQVVKTSLTHWGDWNDFIKRENDAARNTWKRATNTATEQRQNGDDAPDDTATELEVELEGETPLPPLSLNGKTHCPVCGVARPSKQALQDHMANVHDHQPT